MRVETGLSPVLTLKSACVGSNAEFRYFKKNVRVKGLKYKKKIMASVILNRIMHRIIASAVHYSYNS